MHVCIALFAASMALLAEVTESVHVPVATLPSSEAAFLPDGLRSKIKHRSAPLLAFALLAATLSTLFLVLQCFRALHSHQNSSRYGVTRRRLAEGDPGSCTVRLYRQDQGIHTVFRPTPESLSARLASACLRQSWQQRCWKVTREMLLVESCINWNIFTSDLGLL